jgi:prevent-host-death family protein
MALTVKVAEAKARLSELLAKAEAGEEVIISRGSDPIARLSPLRQDRDAARVVDEIKAARNSFALAPVSLEEILEWKAEGRR